MDAINEIIRSKIERIKKIRLLIEYAAECYNAGFPIYNKDKSRYFSRDSYELDGFTDIYFKYDLTDEDHAEIKKLTDAYELKIIFEGVDAGIESMYTNDTTCACVHFMREIHVQDQLKAYVEEHPVYDDYKLWYNPMSNSIQVYSKKHKGIHRACEECSQKTIAKIKEDFQRRMSAATTRFQWCVALSKEIGIAGYRLTIGLFRVLRELCWGY